MEKKKNNIKKYVAIILLIVVLLSVAVYIKNRPQVQIELTQISSDTGNRMMGYVIRTYDNKTVVIDGGLRADSTKLLNKIKEYGNDVDYWIITHPHQDHAGAFNDIIENHNSELNIKELIYTANEVEWYKNTSEASRAGEIEEFYKSLEDEKIKSIKREPQIGENIEISPNINIEILGIKNPEITENSINNSSMVFKMYVNNTSILFLGDTGTESSEKLIKTYGNKLKSDIVQIAHHGQAGGTEELYKLIDPEICLWPTPEWLWDNNSGGGYNSGTWKTLETRKWIEELGVKTNYIAKDGNITITIK